LIERSLDGINFTQVAMVGPNIQAWSAAGWSQMLGTISESELGTVAATRPGPALPASKPNPEAVLSRKHRFFEAKLLVICCSFRSMSKSTTPICHRQHFLMGVLSRHGFL